MIYENDKVLLGKLGQLLIELSRTVSESEEEGRILAELNTMFLAVGDFLEFGMWLIRLPPHSPTEIEFLRSLAAKLKKRREVQAALEKEARDAGE